MKKRRRSLPIVCLAIILAVFCIVVLMTVPRAGTGAGDHPGNRGEAGNPGNGGAEGSVENGEAGDSPGNGGAEGSVENGEAREDPGNEGAGTESVQGGENSPAQGADANADGTSGAGRAVGNGGQGALSDADLEWLMEISRWIPDFTVEGEMDAAFWEGYLFAAYTSDFDREEVVRYSEQYGTDIPYLKVSYGEADETVRQIFGKSLGEYGISPEMLGAGSGNLLYEDGSLLVAASDSPSFRLSVEGVTTADILTEVSLLKTGEDSGEVSRIMLYLLPAENERGFVLDGKEEIPAPQVPEAGDMD